MRTIKDIFKPLLLPGEFILVEVFEFKNNNGNGKWKKVAEANISSWTVQDLEAVQSLYQRTNRTFKLMIDKAK